jgi:SAM-dependent methyltransferase
MSGSAEHDNAPAAAADTFYRSFAGKRLTRQGAARRRRVEATRLALLNRHARPGADLLEIGPGFGGFARAAAEAGWRWRGIEPSTLLAGALRRDGLDVVRAWTPPFPIRSASQDAVYADQVLEHMEGAAEARRFVAEAYRVLRPGGTALFIVPDYAKEGWFFWDIDYTHNFVTTERRMRQLLDDAGFETIEMVKSIGAATGAARRLMAGSALLCNIPGIDALAAVLRAEDWLYRVRKNLFQTLAFVVRKQ